MELNSNQQRIMDELRSSISSGESLSMSDIAIKIGVKSANTILYHIRKLEDMGLLIRDNNGKVVRINETGSVTSAIAYIPVLGNAKCGLPLEQILDESTEKMIPVPLKILNKPMDSKLYLLKAVGDSMLPKIEDGDFVIFEPKNKPQNGDIVVARTKEGFTIKKFKELQQQYVLEPINQKYSPLTFDKDQAEGCLNIDGIAVGVFKSQKNLEGGDS